MTTNDADVLALEETIARELWLICNSQYHSATPERLAELWEAEKGYDGCYRYQNKWLPMARRARALSRPVPDGFVLVPKEPTLDMSIAFAECFYSKRRCIDDADISDWYAAMIAAAPSEREDR
jgi:hypothetical protein